MASSNSCQVNFYLCKGTCLASSNSCSVIAIFYKARSSVVPNTCRPFNVSLVDIRARTCGYTWNSGWRFSVKWDGSRLIKEPMVPFRLGKAMFLIYARGQAWLRATVVR
ncbi:hypothetical protein FNV43_RR12995 [Rhamnella rubrinervis]|uniref:Uncharacterized protein n=1 Tax=Rhamnella rubrinervis TaxID=2594499 RepID=A0A8K0H0E7_9ROSA|nr:hypothetical protein FNV43_RR12995 [Rhamnella rubrinervis]